MSMSADDPVVPPDYPGLRPLPQLIFGSRWLQLPLYLGLIVAQGVYVVLFLKELWHLVLGAMRFTEQEIMLVVLGLIDVVMISSPGSGSIAAIAVWTAAVPEVTARECGMPNRLANACSNALTCSSASTSFSCNRSSSTAASTRVILSSASLLSSSLSLF